MAAAHFSKLLKIKWACSLVAQEPMRKEARCHARRPGSSVILRTMAPRICKGPYASWPSRFEGARRVVRAVEVV